MTTRTHFTFRVETWTPDGESIVEHIAGVEALGVNRTRRDGGNDVNDPERTEAKHLLRAARNAVGTKSVQ